MIKIKDELNRPNEWNDALFYEPTESCSVNCLLQGVETGTIIKKIIYFDSEDEGFKHSKNSKLSNAWNVLVWRFA